MNAVLIGVIGLLRTMGLQGRTEPMRLWGPEGAREILYEAVHLGVSPDAVMQLVSDRLGQFQFEEAR